MIRPSAQGMRQRLESLRDALRIRCGELGNGSAIFAGVGSTEIDASTKITHHSLAPAESVGKAVVHANDVAFSLQLHLYVAGHTILQIQVATLKARLGEPRRFHGRLDILVEIYDVGNVLSMRLRLIPPPHNAEGD